MRMSEPCLSEMPLWRYDMAGKVIFIEVKNWIKKITFFYYFINVDDFFNL